VLSNITIQPSNGSLWVTDNCGIYWTTNDLAYIPTVNINLVNQNGTRYFFSLYFLNFPSLIIFFYSIVFASNYTNTGTYLWPSISGSYPSLSQYYFQICWFGYPSICWQTQQFYVSCMHTHPQLLAILFIYYLFLDPRISVQVGGPIITGGDLNIQWQSSIGYQNFPIVTSINATLLQNNSVLTSILELVIFY